MALKVQSSYKAEDKMVNQLEFKCLNEYHVDCRRADGDASTNLGAMKDGKENDTDITDGQLAAPDGGWGWVVAFGSAVIMTLIPVVTPCFGILFSKYLLREATSSTVTSWIFGVQNIFWSISCLLIKPLSQQFSWRAVGVGGALMASLGFTITSFTPAPEFLFFSFSFLVGVGGGMVTCLCFTVVPSYFEKRRGRANAISMCGMDIGQIAIPSLIIYLQDTFGDRGASLVFSGLMLNACVAAFTFHPVEWHMKVKSADFQLEKGEVTPTINPKASTLTKSSKSMILLRVVKTVISDLGILRSTRACIICISISLAISNLLVFKMMVPFAMQDSGFSLQVSAWTISAMAMASFFSTILFSMLSDLSFFNIRISYVAGYSIMAATTAVFPLLRSTVWVMVNMVGYGIGVGASLSMCSLVMIDVMGMHCLAPMIATTFFCNGIAIIIVGPIIGMIRDASQSYAISIWALAGISSCGIFFWGLMGQATKYDKQRGEDGCPDPLRPKCREKEYCMKKENLLEYEEKDEEMKEDEEKERVNDSIA